LDITAPIVIGATGGSGTRVIARIVRRAGFFTGINRNESEDSMEFPELYDRWINRYVLRDIAPLSTEEEALLLRDFAESVGRHRTSLDKEAPWGWKEPRSIYLLPFLQQQWGQLKFIHVVRDGRDMAFSSNQNQCRKHGPAVLRQDLQDAPQPVRSAALWARINSQMARFGETRMPGRYLRVQYEKICSDPQSTISEILRFLESAAPHPDRQMLNEVVPPNSIGRWRHMGETSVMEWISTVAGEALHRFGYS
jgi:Sulfotransferase family